MTAFAAWADAWRAAPPEAAVVLGSGMDLAGRIGRAERLPFSEVPGLRAPSVPGHAGWLFRGKWAGRRVVVFQGRLHYYEGVPWAQVVEPVRLAARAGARVLVLVNAAGGIHDDLAPGAFMIVRDHVEWTYPYCWRRRATASRVAPYNPRLADRLRDAAERVGVRVRTGVYAAVPGPSYETPAEIRALRGCGADAVGMSTAREAQAACDAGLECAALSCITNRAAGLAAGPIQHEEVLTTAAAQSDRLADWLEDFLTRL